MAKGGIKALLALYFIRTAPVAANSETEQLVAHLTHLIQRTTRSVGDTSLDTVATHTGTFGIRAATRGTNANAILTLAQFCPFFATLVRRAPFRIVQLIVTTNLTLIRRIITSTITAHPFKLTTLETGVGRPTEGPTEREFVFLAFIVVTPSSPRLAFASR